MLASVRFAHPHRKAADANGAVRRSVVAVVTEAEGVGRIEPARIADYAGATPSRISL